MTPTTVGLDLAKNVFHVHVADGSGSVISSQRLTRRELLPFFDALPACIVGNEAGTTAHNWVRRSQGIRHDVRLILPDHVKPYVRRGAKNDGVA